LKGTSFVSKQLLFLLFFLGGKVATIEANAAKDDRIHAFTIPPKKPLGVSLVINVRDLKS